MKNVYDTKLTSLNSKLTLILFQDKQPAKNETEDVKTNKKIKTMQKGRDVNLLERMNLSKVFARSNTKINKYPPTPQGMKLSKLVYERKRVLTL